MCSHSAVAAFLIISISFIHVGCAWPVWLAGVGQAVVDTTSQATANSRTSRAVYLDGPDVCVSVLINSTSPRGYSPAPFIPTGVILGLSQPTVTLSLTWCSAVNSTGGCVGTANSIDNDFNFAPGSGKWGLANISRGFWPTDASMNASGLFICGTFSSYGVALLNCAGLGPSPPPPWANSAFGAETAGFGESGSGWPGPYDPVDPYVPCVALIAVPPGGVSFTPSTSFTPSVSLTQAPSPSRSYSASQTISYGASASQTRTPSWSETPTGTQAHSPSETMSPTQSASPPPPPSTDANTAARGTSAGAVAGAVIGTIAGCALCAGLGYVVIVARSRRRGVISTRRSKWNAAPGDSSGRGRSGSELPSSGAGGVAETRVANVLRLAAAARGAGSTDPPDEGAAEDWAGQAGHAAGNSDRAYPPLGGPGATVSLRSLLRQQAQQGAEIELSGPTAAAPAPAAPPTAPPPNPIDAAVETRRANLLRLAAIKGWGGGRPPESSAVSAPVPAPAPPAPAPAPSPADAAAELRRANLLRLAAMKGWGGARPPETDATPAPAPAPAPVPVTPAPTPSDAAAELRRANLLRLAAMKGWGGRAADAGAVSDPAPAAPVTPAAAPPPPPLQRELAYAPPARAEDVGGDEPEEAASAPAPAPALAHGYGGAPYASHPYASSVGAGSSSWRGGGVLGRLPESGSDDEDGGGAALGYGRYGGGGYGGGGGGGSSYVPEATLDTPSPRIVRSNPLADALASLSESHFGAEGGGGHW